MSGLALLVIAGWLTLILSRPAGKVDSQEASPVASVAKNSGTGTIPDIGLVLPKTGGQISSSPQPEKKNTPSSNPAAQSTSTPVSPVIAPTPTPQMLVAGNCTLSPAAISAYMKPEYYSALQPRFRQSAALPPAPTLYQMNLAIDPGQASYSGQLTLTFWNTSPQAMSTVVLRNYPEFFKAVGGQLSLSEASINNRPATIQSLASTYTELRSEQPVAPCSRAVLKVNFSGKIATRLREDLYSIGTFYNAPGLFALGNFYPQLAVWEKQAGKAEWSWTMTPVRASSDLTSAEAAYYDVQLEVPSTYQIVATGVAAEAKSGTKDLKAWRFIGGPFREFAAVASENFSSGEINGTTSGGVAVKVYTLNTPDQTLQTRQQDFARKALNATIATLDNFGPVVGDYPYTQLSLVQFPLVGFNGVEWPMFTQLSSDIFRNDYSGQEQEIEGIVYSKPGTQVVIHEVLHQWWYNMVGNDQQAEPFIDEGLTEYCSYLIPELHAKRTGGSVEAAKAFEQLWLDKIRSRVRNQDLKSTGDLSVKMPASEYDLGQAGFAYYRKAPLFYDTFRQKFGDTAFFTFLKNYFQRYQYRLVHYNDLANALSEAVPGQESEVEPFINRWLNEKHLAEDLK